MNSSRNKLLWLSCLPKITASLRAETPCLSQSIAEPKGKIQELSRVGEDMSRVRAAHMDAGGRGWYLPSPRFPLR